jgi:hypothetical protein
MRDIKEIIGSLKSNIKNTSRKGAQAIASTAARLQSRTSSLTGRLRRLAGSKGRHI